jgi:hypothetical protein
MADAKADSTKTAVLLDDFVTSLRRRKVEGSLDTAKRTALLMRHVIADARTPNPADLIAAVRAAGVRLSEACNTGAFFLRGRQRDQRLAQRPRCALHAARCRQPTQQPVAPLARCALRPRGCAGQRTALSIGFFVARPDADAHAHACAAHAELSIGNIVRRVLHIIREEAATAEAAGDDGGSERVDSDLANRAGARVPSLATLLEVPSDNVSSPQCARPLLSCELVHCD